MSGGWGAVAQSCDTFSLSLSDNSSLLALLILGEIQNGSAAGLVRSVEEPKWQRSAARWLAVCLDPLNDRFWSVSTQAEGLVCNVFVFGYVSVFLSWNML